MAPFGYDFQIVDLYHIGLRPATVVEFNTSHFFLLDNLKQQQNIPHVPI